MQGALVEHPHVTCPRDTRVKTDERPLRRRPIDHRIAEADIVIPYFFIICKPNPKFDMPSAPARLRPATIDEARLSIGLKANNVGSWHTADEMFFVGSMVKAS
jgi:hypothetical protein